MSQQPQITSRSRQVACLAIVAVLSLLGASSAHAQQWAAKPAPPLPRTVLDQAISGSVVLGLVFENSGAVRDVRIVRSSGVSGLDEIAQKGAMKWRLNPAALQPSDMTVGRQHLIKFFQNAQIYRRVEPFKAYWQEL